MRAIQVCYVYCKRGFRASKNCKMFTKCMHLFYYAFCNLEMAPNICSLIDIENSLNPLYLPNLESINHCDNKFTYFLSFCNHIPSIWKRRRKFTWVPQLFVLLHNMFFVLQAELYILQRGIDNKV